MELSFSALVSAAVGAAALLSYAIVYACTWARIRSEIAMARRFDQLS